MKKIIIYSLFILGLWACKEKYISPVISPNTGYLVVEGIINSGTGETNIILSRTLALSSNSINYERGAKVNVEGDDNSLYPLKEISSGHYTVTNLNLNANKKYRINIATVDGKKYLSDFAAVKSNPAIDSINYKTESQGLQFYIDTHDPTNNTKYYQWDYTETWEFHSSYQTYLKYKIANSSKGQQYSVVFSDSTRFAFDMGQYICWKTENSSSILTGSTATLSSDIIHLPILSIPPASWKLSVLYSVNVKQYSLSKGRYEFLQRMKKNTEGTGSIFDAQPSELSGNIYCTTNNDPVIGYIDVCPVQEKRIFVDPNKVPNWPYWLYKPNCTEIEVPNNSDSIQVKAINLLPTNYKNINTMTGAIISFYAAPPECVDCRLRGSNIKPSFWK
jgi:hypothetical protein